jgi:hypothetical protein
MASWGLEQQRLSVRFTSRARKQGNRPTITGRETGPTSPGISLAPVGFKKDQKRYEIEVERMISMTI